VGRPLPLHPPAAERGKKLCHAERSEASIIELFNRRIDPSFLRMTKTKKKKLPLSAAGEERDVERSDDRASRFISLFKIVLPHFHLQNNNPTSSPFMP